MRYPWLDAYLLSLPGAEKRYHPAWKMFLYEVRGKLFAAVCSPEKRFRTYGGHDLVNLRCEPAEGEVLRAVWPEALEREGLIRREGRTVYLIQTEKEP